ncbi:MAG: hypothetical protein KC620_26085 [Myxococcales bacterium]|nr:hypothetical protein [Myxococcales bacterium]
MRQGHELSERELALVYALGAAAGGEALSRAEIGRRLNLSRQTVSIILNQRVEQAQAAYEALAAAGALEDALSRLGLVESEPAEPVVFDPLEEPREIDPEAVCEASAHVGQGLPFLESLVLVGCDRAEAMEWLAEAGRMTERGTRGWPASGYRALDRARASVVLAITSAVLSGAPGAEAKVRLGRLVHPELFNPPTDNKKRDPLEAVSDERLTRLALGDLD